MFEGFLTFREACPVCGLAFRKIEVGDGPAVFGLFVIGTLAVALAFVARYAWFWSIGAAFALSAGLTVALTLALLRPARAALLALYWRKGAGPGA